MRAIDLFPKKRYETVEEWSGGMLDMCDYLAGHSNDLLKDKEVRDELQQFGNIIENKFKVKSNELLLGSSTLDWDETVVKKFTGNVISATVVSKKGKGKTQMAKSIFVEQMPMRFNRYCLILDPKMDYIALDSPQNEPELVERLKKYHLKPAVINPYYCHPEFCDIFGARGKSFALTYDDIQKLENKPIKVEILKELLNISISGDSASYDILNSLVSQGIPLQFEALISKLRELSKARAQAMERQGGSGKIVALFQSLYQIGVLGDDPMKTVLFPNMLKKHKYLVVQLPREGSKELYPSCIVKYIIKKIISDRKKYVMVGAGEEEGVLDRKITVLADEAHLLCPRKGNSPSKEAITKIFTTERQTGFDCVLISQNPEQLDDMAITQSDWLMTTRVENPAIQTLLRERGMSPSEIETVSKRLFDHPRKKPVEWMLHDANETHTYFPLPPVTSMITENTKGWSNKSPPQAEQEIF